MKKRSVTVIIVCTALLVALGITGAVVLPSLIKGKAENSDTASCNDTFSSAGAADVDYAVETITVTENGVKANDPDAAESNLKALNKIANSVKSGTTVIFPSGKYYVSADRGSGGILLYKKSNIMIKGEDGAVLINTAFTPYADKESIPFMKSNILNIAECDNVVIDGLSFDYNEVTSVSGTITAKTDSDIIITVDSEYSEREVPLKDGGFADSIHFFDKNNVPTEEDWLDDTTKLKKCADGVNTFSLNCKTGNVGDRVCVRFVGWSNTAPICNFNSINGLTVKNIRVFSSPAACFYSGGDSSEYLFENVTVEAKDGSTALMSSNSDGIHISGLRGRLAVRNCRFIGMGDDALNIHLSAPTIELVNENSITLTNDDMKKAVEYCKPGDVIEFFSLSKKPLGKATVVKSDKGVVTFDDLPEDVYTSSVINNLSRQPKTLFENCTVKRGRARGVLLQSREATVTNCTFEDLRLPGVLAAPDFSKWREMGPMESLTVSGCTFKNCCNARKKWGAVTVNVGHDQLYPSSPKLHGTVTVKENTYDGIDVPYIIYGAENTVTD